MFAVSLEIQGCRMHKSVVSRSMMNTFGLLAMVAIAGTVMSANTPAYGADVVAVSADDMVRQFPGLQTYQWEGKTQMIYGVPMLMAPTSEAVASQWISRYATAFGAGALDLELVSQYDFEDGAKTVFTYSQRLDGIPVEFGMVKVITLNTAEGSTVVSGSAKIAAMPEGGLRESKLTGEQAVSTIRAMREYRSMPLWGEPEMVVYQGEGDFANWITPTVVWKFTGEMPVGTMARKFTFLVDANSGHLIHARNEILHVNVTGQVRVRATPSNPGNAAADHAGNPPVERSFPNIRVRINGSNANSVYTDANGNFNIPWAGTTPVTIDASVGDGQWGRVVEQNAGQPLVTASTTATPGTPATLLLNPAPSGQFPNAQVNALIHQNSTRNFFKTYAPTFTALDTQLTINTGVTGTCNAFYNGTSTNYYNVGGTCNNTAFSSIVAHEYGHHIVNRLGLAQGGFGEGFGDTMSILQYDDFVLGRYFQTNGGAVRTPDTTNRQYPCTGCAVHTSGLVLGGVVCEVRRNLGNKYGSAMGLEAARALHIKWALTTLGGEGENSASPRSLIEYLVANDNDGNLTNGTPDGCEIFNAFGQHNIFSTTPGVSDAVVISVTSATPDYIAPRGGLVITATAAGTCRVPVPNSMVVMFRNGAGAYGLRTMSQVSPNSYAVTISAAECDSGVLQYYLVVGTTTAGGAPAANVTFPTGGISNPVTIPIATNVVTTNDSFETNTGWTVGPNTATSGLWVRANPVGTAAQPEDDVSDPGTICWVTGNGTPGGQLGAADVDGGATVLTSPTYNLAGSNDVEVSYWRWYSNGMGAGPYADTFRVDVSTNNGSTWTRAETVGPGSASDPNVLPQWRFASWRLSTLGLTPSAQIRVRFTAEDAGEGSLVEAALDEFTIRGVSCNDVSCPADFNQDGGIDGADVEAFFTAWEQGEATADVNGDGGVDGNDVETFFIAWQAGGC